MVRRLPRRQPARARLLHRDGPRHRSQRGGASAQLAAAGPGQHPPWCSPPVGDLLRGPDRPQLRQPRRLDRIRRHPAVLPAAGCPHRAAGRRRLPMETPRHPLYPPSRDPRSGAAFAGGGRPRRPRHPDHHRDQRAPCREHQLLWPGATGHTARRGPSGLPVPAATAVATHLDQR